MENVKKRVSSRSTKFGVRGSQNGSFSTFEDFLSRNVTFFALKRLITFILDGKVENESFPEPKTPHTS